MAKEMTFDKYIDNPSGGSVYTNRNMYKNMYKSKFDKVLVREQGRIKYELYVAKDNVDSHYVYLKIPSEVVPNFYYDVVIQFYTKNVVYKNEKTLRRYSVKFYSNDPAFAYTFAHSSKQNELFISDLEARMPKQLLKNKAKIKNPKDEVWYVKSLFFAYLAMEKYNLFSKAMFSNQYRKKELLNKITPAEIKIAKRQEEGKKIEKQKAKEAEEKKKEKQTVRNVNISVPQTKISKTSKVSKVSNSVKKTRIIGER